MSVCLVTASTVAEFADPAEIRSESVSNAARNPQLGILSLAAVLEARGESVRIMDLNRVYLDYFESHSTVDGSEFAESAAHIVTVDDADIYGFSSICSSYPLTLRIARAVKALRPQATIVLGGPQASVVDLQTLSVFPFIDLILRGEAEQTLALLLDQLRGDRQLEKVPGLSYRVGAGPHRNPNAALINDLNSIPSPAYHLSQYLQGSKRASLELGRGCPFSCTFCSTNDFFRRKFRLRSPERVLRDMRSIAANYAIRDFELVHDMFTVDRKRVAAFCEAMIASGEGFTWSCSARTDCIDEELLEVMAKAGCRGIFYGVEVGSQKMQKVIDKHLNTARAHEIIDATERRGIGSTVSLISGFPEETWDDVRRSMDFFMHSARCPKSHPQLNLLAPLAETPLLTKHRDELILEELCSCVSHQARRQDRADVEMIVAYPEIFPNFYVIPTPHLERDRLFELREFTLMGLARFRWMLVAIHQSTSGILDFFNTWREHRLRIRPALVPSDLRQYYRTDDFRTDFADFVRTGKMGRTSTMRALLDYEDALRRSLAADTRTVPAGDLLPPGAALDPNDIPVRRNRILVFELGCDIQRIVDALKLQKKPVQSRVRHFYVTRPVSAASSRIDRISDWMANLLRLCDGRCSVKEIVRQLSARLPEVQKSLREYVCMRLLQGAENEQFIVVYRTARDSVAPNRRAASEA
ncbi:MAG TPA: radical SAM protein [Terriglobales bacterium]|nr:radical SAM protein [Terriglobales bacterium]